MALSLDDVVDRLRSLRALTNDRTAWIALSGSPASGKSTILAKLRDRGYSTRTECARSIFERELAMGKSLQTVTQDPAYLVEQIFNANLAVVNQTPRSQKIVFDRSLIDVLAFGLIDGVDIERYIARAATFRFNTAFIFERMHKPADPTLYHNEDQRLAIEEACSRLYAALGAQVTYVPMMSPNSLESIQLRLTLIEETLR